MQIRSSLDGVASPPVALPADPETDPEFDAEVEAEAEALLAGWRGRRADSLAWAARWRGVGDVRPEPVEPEPDRETLVRRARAEVARRRAWRQGAEGRFVEALGDAQRAAEQALRDCREARLARRRCFTRERDLCRRLADALVDQAEALRLAARDARLAADG